MKSLGEGNASGYLDQARPSWRRRRLGLVARGLVLRVEVLRLAFGAVWLIDAYLKWQPAFISGYAGNLADGASGQPAWLRPWFRFWRHLVNLDPHLFAYATAAIETLIAAGLILGIARRAVYVGGMLWSTAIWTIPEGFGGSFVAGATDIGTALVGPRRATGSSSGQFPHA